MSASYDCSYDFSYHDRIIVLVVSTPTKVAGQRQNSTAETGKPRERRENENDLQLIRLHPYLRPSNKQVDM